MSGSNELWLLYLDFSDWHPHSGVSKGLRKVKSKLVSGVGVQADETSEKEMRVTENLGSSTFLYQMAHPAVDPICTMCQLCPLLIKALALQKRCWSQLIMTCIREAAKKTNLKEERRK